MRDYDVERLLGLLGKVVEQNAEAIRQNQEMLLFLEKRDAHLAEFTELRIEVERLELEKRRRDKALLAIEEAHLVSLGTSVERMRKLETHTAMLRAHSTYLFTTKHAEREGLGVVTENAQTPKADRGVGDAEGEAAP